MTRSIVNLGSVLKDTTREYNMNSKKKILYSAH